MNLEKILRRDYVDLSGVISTAIYSKDEKHRYYLSRTWDKSLPKIAFLMLNPSTATEEKNDPTLERCQRRAAAMGGGGFIIINLFSFRSTDPKGLKTANNPEGGKENDEYIIHVLKNPRVSTVICGWGVHGGFNHRDKRVIGLFNRLERVALCLGTTKEGFPRHPLYVSYSVQPIPYKISG